MTKFIWIIIGIIAIVILYLMTQNNLDMPYQKHKEEKTTLHTGQNKVTDNDSNELSKNKISPKKSNDKTKSIASNDVLSKNQKSQVQSQLVAPKKPKYTFKELESLNLSDEEKSVIEADILAYESYKVRNEPPALSEIDKELQSTNVTPKKPEYTLDELETLNISDEEKSTIKADIIAYESYKVKDEPSALSEKKEIEMLKNLGHNPK